MIVDVDTDYNNPNDEIKPECQGTRQVEYTDWGSGTLTEYQKTIDVIDCDEKIPLLIDAITELRRDVRQLRKQVYKIASFIRIKST